MRQFGHPEENSQGGKNKIAYVNDWIFFFKKSGFWVRISFMIQLGSDKFEKMNDPKQLSSK